MHQLVNKWNQKLTSLFSETYVEKYKTTGVDDAQITELETQLGISLPESLKQFYQPQNYISDSVSTVYKIQSLVDDYGYDVLPFEQIFSEHKFLYEFNDEFEEISYENENCNVSEAIKLDKYHNFKWIPIAQNYQGDYILVDLDPSNKGTFGQIIELQNDSWNRLLVASSLENCLQQQLEKLNDTENVKELYALDFEKLEKENKPSSDDNDAQYAKLDLSKIESISFKEVKTLFPKELHKDFEDDNLIEVIHGDWELETLNLSEPFIDYEDRMGDYELYLREQISGVFLVTGNLKVKNIISSSHYGFKLIVLGSIECENMLVTGSEIYVEQAVRVQECFWGDGDNGSLNVKLEIFAKVFIATDDFQYDKEKVELTVAHFLSDYQEISETEQFDQLRVAALFIPEVLRDDDDAYGWESYLNKDAMMEQLLSGNSIINNPILKVYSELNAKIEIPKLFEAVELTDEKSLQKLLPNYEKLMQIVTDEILDMTAFYFENLGAKVLFTKAHTSEAGINADESIGIILDDFTEIYFWKKPEVAIKKLLGSKPKLTLNCRIPNTSQGVFEKPDLLQKLNEIWKAILDRVEHGVYYLKQLNEIATYERILSAIQLQVVRDKYNDYSDADKCVWLGDYNLAFDLNFNDWHTFRTCIEIPSDDFDARNFYYDAYPDQTTQYSYLSSQLHATSDMYSKEHITIQIMDWELLKEAIKIFKKSESLIQKHNETYLKNGLQARIIFPNRQAETTVKLSSTQALDLQQKYGFSDDYAHFLKIQNGFSSYSFCELTDSEDYLNTNEAAEAELAQEIQVLYNAFSNDEHYDLEENQKNNIFKDLFFVFGCDGGGNEFIEILVGKNKGYIGVMDHEMYFSAETLEDFKVEFEIEGETNVEIADAIIEADVLVQLFAKSMKDFIENGIYLDRESNNVMVKDLMETAEEEVDEEDEETPTDYILFYENIPLDYTTSYQDVLALQRFSKEQSKDYEQCQYRHHITLESGQEIWCKPGDFNGLHNVTGKRAAQIILLDKPRGGDDELRLMEEAIENEYTVQVDCNNYHLILSSDNLKKQSEIIAYLIHHLAADLKSKYPHYWLPQNTMQIISYLEDDINKQLKYVFNTEFVQLKTAKSSFWHQGFWGIGWYYFFSFEKLNSAYKIRISWTHPTIPQLENKSNNMQVVTIVVSKPKLGIAYYFLEDLNAVEKEFSLNGDLALMEKVYFGYFLMLQSIKKEETELQQTRAEKDKRDKQIVTYSVSKPFEKVTINDIVFTLKDRLEAAELLETCTDLEEDALPFDAFEMFSLDDGDEDVKSFFLVAEEEVKASELYLDTLITFNQAEIYVLGYIFKEKVTLSKYVQAYDFDFSPPLICLKDANISSVILSGTAHYFHQDLTATTIYGKYNHGSLYVKGNATANLIYADDFTMYFKWIDAADAIVCEDDTIFRAYSAMDENENEFFFTKLVPAMHRLQDCVLDDFLFYDEYGCKIKEDGYFNDERLADENTFLNYLKEGKSVLDDKKMNALGKNFKNTVVSWLPKIFEHPKLNALAVGDIQCKYPNLENENEYYYFYKGNGYYQIGFWNVRLHYVSYCTVSQQDPEDNKGSIIFYENDNETAIFELTEDFLQNSMSMRAVQLTYFQALEQLGLGFSGCTSYPISQLYFDFVCFDEAHKYEYADSFFIRESITSEASQKSIASWSDNTEFLRSFQEFGQANGSGSGYAFWLIDANIDKCPIVVFGDEGGIYVVAKNLLDFMHILSYDAEIFIHDGISFGRDEDDYEESEQRHLYLEWLKTKFNLLPLNDEAEVGKLIQKAKKKYQTKLEQFLEKFGIEI